MKDRNFCDLYEKLFPKLMESKASLVMMTGLHVDYSDKDGNVSVGGTGIVIKGAFEKVGSVWDDWAIENFSIWKTLIKGGNKWKDGSSIAWRNCVRSRGRKLQVLDAVKKVYLSYTHLLTGVLLAPLLLKVMGMQTVVSAL